jgi:hypothetical protein
MRQAGVVLLAFLGLGALAGAQDAEVEFTQNALNNLVHRLADPSDGGVFTPSVIAFLPSLYEQCDFVGYFDCPPLQKGGLGASYTQIPLVRCRQKGGTVRLIPAGAPVSWQWWVMGAHYTITPGGMTLTATVRWRVDKTWYKDERTVGATFELDATTNTLRIKVADFKVPIVDTFYATPSAITEVDVGKLLGLAVPIPPRTIQLPLIDGGTRNLTGSATSIATDYLAGRARVKFDVAFN